MGKNELEWFLGPPLLAEGLIVMNPGIFWFSVPSPYVTQLPTEGRTRLVAPVVQEQSARAVRHTLGLHRVDHAHLVDVLGHVRKQLGDMLAAFAVLLEVPERLQQFSLATGTKRAQT